ncbi:putative ABC transport system ATP-binding protein [Peptoniphilus ivorii]|nr:putative ABC transport system ATP-binding protein [Peptoniphilus ivorii]
MDTPTAGTILLKDKDLARIPEKEMAKFRRENLGFVFQDFHLLDTFTVKENILLPLVLREEAPRQMEEKLAPLARRLGIADLLDKYPYEISGGQQQRAAICRALVTEPEILLADEPTGALDSHASRELLETFEEIHAAGQTILMVTHSVKAASRAKRVLFIRDGVIFHQLYKGNATNFEAEERIAATMQMLGRGSRDV